MVKYRCLHCLRTWWNMPGPQTCPHCGSLELTRERR